VGIELSRGERGEPRASPRTRFKRLAENGLISPSASQIKRLQPSGFSGVFVRLPPFLDFASAMSLEMSLGAGRRLKCHSKCPLAKWPNVRSLIVHFAIRADGVTPAPVVAMDFGACNNPLMGREPAHRLAEVFRDDRAGHCNRALGSLSDA
jgi:hypothetical protein